MIAPLVVYDYGEYDKLFASRDLKRAMKLFCRVAARLKMRYWIVGGSAVYLHVQNPPRDMPDIDVMLDVGKAAGLQFISALSESGFDIDMVERDAPEDVFATLRYGSIWLDVFTSQESRPDMKRTVKVRGLDVEPVEPLLVEKAIRASYEDILMAVDLLAYARYDVAILQQTARRYRVWGRLALLSKVARSYKKGVLSAFDVCRFARMMARGEGKL